MVSLLIDFHEPQRQIQSSVVINPAQHAGSVHVNYGKEARSLIVFFFKLRYNLDTIKFSLSVQFCCFQYIHKVIVTIITNYRVFSSKQKSHFQQQSFPISSSPQPLKNTDVLSVSMDLPIVYISHIESCNTCFFVQLLQNSIKLFRFIHVVCCISSSVLFMAELSRQNHLLIIHSSVDSHFGCFHFLALMNHVTMNIYV